MKQILVITTGFEPVTVCLEGRCSIQLSYVTIPQKKYSNNATHKETLMKYLFLSGRQDSNLRPPGPKPGAMTGLRYAPKLYLTICIRCGETGTRTQATVTRRQISNLLRYHSGTSPFMYMNLLFLFCGCKGITIFHFLQVFCKLFLIFFIKYLVNSYLSNI